MPCWDSAGWKNDNVTTDACLRRLRIDDAPNVLAAFLSAEDMSRQGEVSTLEQARHYVARLVNPEDAHWAWALFDGKVLVGLVVVTVDIENLSGWFWYWMNASHRGRGLTGRAAATVANWALSDGGLHRLELGHRVTNAASGTVARVAGFVQEGLERKKFLDAGVRIDVLTYGRLRSDDWPTTIPLPMSSPESARRSATPRVPPATRCSGAFRADACSVRTRAGPARY